MRASFLVVTLFATSAVFSMLNPIGGGGAGFWGGSPGYTSSSSSYYVSSAPQISYSAPVVQEVYPSYSAGYDVAPMDSSTIIGASLTGKKKKSKRKAHK